MSLHVFFSSARAETADEIIGPGIFCVHFSAVTNQLSPSFFPPRYRRSPRMTGSRCNSLPAEIVHTPNFYRACCLIVSNYIDNGKRGGTILTSK